MPYPCRTLLFVGALVLASPLRAAHWAGIGPYGGVVHDLAVDPQTPSTVYAVTAGGVFRSADGGATWAPRSTGIHAFSYSEGFGHLAIDAAHPATLYLVRTLNPDTLLKTTDAGLTWTRTSLGGLDNPRSVAVHPRSSDTIYVMAFDRMAVSTDGGGTWLSTPVVASAEPLSLALDPVSPAVAYLGTGFAYSGEGGVYKTTDAGRTWQQVNAGLTSLDIVAVATHPTDAQIVHAAADATSFHSENGGTTWTEAAVPVTCVYFDALRVDPAMPQRVYAATCHGVFASTDGGVTWSPATTGITLSSTLAVAPSPDGVVYAGSEGHGVFRSVDGGATWVPSNQGLAAASVMAFVLPPSTAQTIYAGTLRQGLAKTTDGGAHWARSDDGIAYPTGETIDALALDPQTPTTVYVVAGGRVFKSVDAAASWAPSGGGLPTNQIVRTIVVDRVNPAVLYVGLSTSGPTAVLVYKSTDGAASWTPTALVQPSSFAISAVATDPLTTGVVYAGGFGGLVSRSSDGGASWAAAPVTRFAAPVLALAVDPHDPAVVYAGSADGLSRSSDQGASWSRLAFPSFEAPALALDAATPGRLFASAFSGVIASLDAGGTFADVSGDIKSGISVYEIPALALDPQNPNRLLAATIGGSIQAGLLAPCAADADCASGQDLCQVGACVLGAAAADAFGCRQTRMECPGDECHFDGRCDDDSGECSNDPFPDGVPCPDDTSCTVDTCEAGACRHDPSLLASCFDVTAKGGAAVSLRDGSASTARFSWKWRRGEAFVSIDLGDPFLRTGYTLCVADHGGPLGRLRLVMAADVPAGGTCGDRSCWRPHGLDLRYHDGGRVADGVDRINLHPGAAGKARVVVSGNGANLDLTASVPLTPGVTVQLRRTDSPICWRATFDQLISRNVGGAFVARSGGD